MKRTYIVKADHWQENFKCYAVFNESDSAELAILSSCCAASCGSGWVKAANLSEWSQNQDQLSLDLLYGPSGDYSMELRKQDGYVVIDLEGGVFQLSLDLFMRLLAAWDQIVLDEPIVVELSEEGGVYALASSKGKRLLVE